MWNLGEGGDSHVLEAFEGDFSFTCTEAFEKGNNMLLVKHETQTLPIMANFKDGLDHKDKHFDTRRKIWSQEMIMDNVVSLILII